MHELIRHYTIVRARHEESHRRLLEEIAYLEARLLAIGQTGDCAYEKSLARSYAELLHARRRQLASLN